MKITVTAGEPKDNELTAQLTIPTEDVDSAVKAAYKDIANKYSFKGFRRGRTPRPVIDSLVGKEAVLAQATNALLNEAEPLMLEELDIVPVEQSELRRRSGPCQGGRGLHDRRHDSGAS
ncbi:MAG: trigger factor family protein [Atopobiaceae bacterium]|nr:trigger factor family protein [Atopobiaceae bacterium]